MIHPGSGATGVRSGRSARLGAALAAVVLWGATACSETPEPAPLNADSASPSDTAPAPDAPPTLPAEARGDSERAARAFVRHWVDVLNHSTANVQSKRLRALSSKRCRPCLGISDSLDDVRSAGGEITGGVWKIKGIRTLPSTGESVETVQFVVSYGPQSVVASEGAEPTKFDPGRTVYTVDLVQASPWKVQDIRGTE